MNKDRVKGMMVEIKADTSEVVSDTLDCVNELLQRNGINASIKKYTMASDSGVHVIILSLDNLTVPERKQAWTSEFGIC